MEISAEKWVELRVDVGISDIKKIISESSDEDIKSLLEDIYNAVGGITDEQLSMLVSRHKCGTETFKHLSDEFYRLASRFLCLSSVLSLRQQNDKNEQAFSVVNETEIDKIQSSLGSVYVKYENDKYYLEMDGKELEPQWQEIPKYLHDALIMYQRGLNI